MDMKRQHPDCVLLFRLWDFYEVFYEDAHIAHKVLWITLTARDKQAEHPIPMAWIPHHALERYLPALIQAWYKVALADQVGEVVPWRLVERKITQVFTPGTRVESGSLAIYIAALVQYEDHRALAWGDVSLWTWTTKYISTRDEVYTSLLRIWPREIICDWSVHGIADIERRAHDHLSAIVSSVPVISDPQHFLLHVLGVRSLESYGPALDVWVAAACATLFHYIQYNKQHICVRRIESRQQQWTVFLDQLTIKNLEIFQWSYQGSKKHSLFWVINTCATSMWSRLLAYLLWHPTQNADYISSMQAGIRHWYERHSHAKKIHTLLWELWDIPRIAQQISQKKRPILLLANLAYQIVQVDEEIDMQEMIASFDKDMYWRVISYMRNMKQTIQEHSTDDTNWLVEWYDEEVDRLRHIDNEVDGNLLSYQQSRIERTWVPVKIKHVTNQWYFLEVTPKDIKKFESFFVLWDSYWWALRAQTLKTGQRYTSTYLQELQADIYNAQENLAARHRQLAEEYFDRRQTVVDDVYRYADCIAQGDVQTSMALLMHEKDRSLPRFTSDATLHITAWRHPVVEAYMEKGEQFIPNDTLCTKDHFFHLITWPNMWGKSTYMRQQAIIVLLAHAWLPVPATEVSLPYMDGIFARIWSGDILAKQQSTFMTEMIETASILHNATEHSFIVFDELGRGTSTTDWLALAKAIIVYICRYIKAKTLFATHYHELIEIAWTIDWVENRHVGVYESANEVVFLKKICPGWADKSYWIDVAKIAWIPKEIITLATEYLTHIPSHKDALHVVQSPLFALTTDTLGDELSSLYWSLDIDTITPIEALNILQQIIIKLRK